MEKNLIEIPVELTNGETVYLKIKGNRKKTLFHVTDNELTEAPYQICEGNFYDYVIEKPYYLKDSFGISSPNKFEPWVGTIAPNIYVGTLTLGVYGKKEDDEENPDQLGTVRLEVQSVKTDYRHDYRQMLKDITEHCVDLIFRLNTPVTQPVDPDYEHDSKTLHQKFAFVKSVLDNDEFYDAVNKVLASPVTKWKENETVCDIRNIKKAGSKILRQFSSASNRIPAPESHHLYSLGIKSVPSRLRFTEKTETVDTPENRFIKYALSQFLFFVSDFASRLGEANKTKLEVLALETYLEQALSHSVFKDISEPDTLVLNSPVLQRKEGYREILKIWLMFGLAAQLSWKGGNDVYNIEKRDVATLYEYWLFFELLKIIEKVFGIKPKDDLIVSSNDGLDLQLKQGKSYSIEGTCEKYSRHLNIRFSYNRTFSGSMDTESYPQSGSWTRNMRPDYTLSVWPAGMKESEAEKQEFIVHVHFDAKYKIEQVLEALSDADPDKEKEEQRKGTYKRADLLKMHSYKDAIRRTAGAYILYPGKTAYERRGFRELLPGLGAFQIRPSETGDTGTKDLEKFFDEIVKHFMDRTSQREKTAYRIFDIHKNKPENFEEINAIFGNEIETNRDLFPDETNILVGYCSTEQYKWVIQKKIYNFRTDNFKLSPANTGAKYLLLHAEGELETGHIFQLKKTYPKIVTKEWLLQEGYPKEQNTDRTYILFEIEKSAEDLFNKIKWNIRKLEQYRGGQSSGIPFTVNLKELMASGIK